MLFASTTSTCLMFCNIAKTEPSYPSYLLYSQKKFHPFGLWHIPLFPFPALKSEIIKNVFLHIHKLFIEMKSIYKISLMLVLWKQAVQMTDCLLRWKNKISALILCSHLVRGYGDVQMEKPVPGKHHKPLLREREEISLLPSWQYTARPPCPAEWFSVFSSDGTWYQLLPSSNGTPSLSFNSKTLQKPWFLIHFLILKQEPMHYFCLQTSLK